MRYPYENLTNGLGSDNRTKMQKNFDDIESDIRELEQKNTDTNTYVDQEVGTLRDEKNTDIQQLRQEKNADVDDVQQQIDNMVLQAGDSSAEVLQARGPFNVLNTRMVSIEANIETKATKEELENVLDGSPKATYATLAELQAAFPDGAQGVYLVTADGHIYSWDGSTWVDRGVYQAIGISNKSVTAPKIVNLPGSVVNTETLANGSKVNMFDKSTVVQGSYVTNAGVISSSATLALSQLIPVTEGATYTVSSGYTSQGGVYDKNGQWIAPIPAAASSTGVPHTFTVPSGGVFVRLNMNSDKPPAWMMVPGGTYPAEYVEYGVDVSWIKAPVQPKSVKAASIADAELINMFDKTTITSDKYVTNTGTISSSTSLVLSDFIQVNEGEKYTVSSGYTSQGGVYNSNKQWIAPVPAAASSTNAPHTFTVPAGGAFVRLNMNSDKPATWMMSRGETLPSEYIDYGIISIPWLKQDILITQGDLNIALNAKQGAESLSLGDSISWQDGRAYASGQQSGQIARGYQTILREKLGMVFTNGAISGASMVNDGSAATPVTVKGKTYDYTLFNVAMIWAGTNDFNKGYPIGNIGLMGDATFDDTTFYGAYRSLIEYILTANPQIRLYLMTPLQRNYNYLAEREANKVNAAGHKLIDYVSAVIKLGEMYGLPVIDLYRNSMLTDLTLQTYTRDGLHPIDIGYARIAEVIVPFVQMH